MAIPKAMQAKYDEIMPWIHAFCQDFLDVDHEDICRRLLEKLCRKRPSPLLKGRTGSWAAGIVYAIASLNFIFDESNPYHMSAGDIAAEFNVSKATAANKASEIRRIVGLSQLDPEWMLPSVFAEIGLLDGYGTININDIPDERKLSAKLIEIMEPWIEELDIATLARCASLAWNGAVSGIDVLTNQDFSEEQSMNKVLIEALKKRKNELFPDDMRTILSTQVRTDEDGDTTIIVKSRLDPEAYAK